MILQILTVEQTVKHTEDNLDQARDIIIGQYLSDKSLLAVLLFVGRMGTSCAHRLA